MMRGWDGECALKCEGEMVACCYGWFTPFVYIRWLSCLLLGLLLCWQHTHMHGCVSSLLACCDSWIRSSTSLIFLDGFLLLICLLYKTKVKLAPLAYDAKPEASFYDKISYTHWWNLPLQFKSSMMCPTLHFTIRLTTKI